ncbi:MAG: hypothetical protein LBQ58_06415 [Synergistaceae bacterium]|nr:hypothetical protein [Synergistaceae bacterium]
MAEPFKDFPLVFNDERAVSGNASYDNTISRVQLDLRSNVDSFQAKLPADIWVKFDEAQAEWERCYRDETVAYGFADAWTRPNPDAAYDNQYRENRLVSVLSRLNLLHAIASTEKGQVDSELYEQQKTALLGEIAMDMYHVITWTKEMYRHRIKRANDSWGEYYKSSLALFEALCKNDKKRAMELDLVLLTARRDVVSIQKEALYRIKIEPED